MKFYDINNELLTVYGMNRKLQRMPETIAKNVSEGVYSQYNMPAGGRIRFSTNSSVITVKVKVSGSRDIGFDLYKVENGCEIFAAGFRKPDCFLCDGDFESSVHVPSNNTMHSYTLNFPYLGKFEDFHIGIEDDAVLERGTPYINSKPVVFYGSSITHGAWATRPGTTYESMISQKYNLHYLNLGFAGSAKGEKEIVDYMAGLDMSAFVCDYDHNAYDLDLLQSTHLPMYKTIREANPDILYIILTRPDYFSYPKGNDIRNAVIKETYNYAIKNGDKKIWFVNGKSFFEGEYYYNCTKDGCHPNDIGFYRMAQKIGDVLALALGLEKRKHNEYLENDTSVVDDVAQNVNKL